MAQPPVRTGAAVVAVFFAALIGTVIVIAEAIVRLLSRIHESRSQNRR